MRAGFNIQIVGRLIQQQHVGALLQGIGQMQTAALTAREFADAFLLVGAAEVKASRIGAEETS